MSKKKIMFISHQLSRTGAPIVLLDMINLCLKHGYSVDVTSMMDGELREELERIGITPTISERFYPDKDTFAQEWKNYDLIVVNTLVAYEAIHVLRGCNIPVLWWLHEGRQYFEYFKTVLPDFNTISDSIHVYAVSPYVQKTVKDIYGCTLPILNFAVDGYDGDYSSHYKNGSDKVRFLTAGTYSKIKGQDILAEAIKRLSADYLSKTEFYFCGNESQVDPDVYNSITECAAQYDNVKMLHQLTRQDTIHQMEMSDCLIVPSRIDPLPTVAIEMLMTGGAVMCTNACGISCYLKDGESAVIVDTENSQELADNIMKMADDKALLASIGNKGHDVYEKHFSREAVEPNMLEIIENLANTGIGGGQ